MYTNTKLKYRPKNLSEFIFANDELENIVNSYVYGKQTMPLILHGTFGTGKSLLAELIPKAIDGDDVQVNKIRSIDLNSSKEVYGHFERNKQFDHLFKVNDRFNYYIIEEVNFDPKAKGAFRTVIEDNEGVDLIILTTNEVHKIDQAIISRSNVVEVPPLKPDQFIDRAMQILSQEKVLNAESSKIIKMLELCYSKRPDNREYYKELDKIMQQAKVAA